MSKMAWSIFMYTNPPPFHISIFLQSLSTTCSSRSSPYVLFPWCHVLCIFILYGKARTHPSLLLVSTRAWHLHVPATRLLIEDRLQVGVIVGVVADAYAAVVGLGWRLVSGGLGVCCGRIFWPLCKRVKFWFKGVGGTRILGASRLPLWQECLPPFGPLCGHIWLDGAGTGSRCCYCVFTPNLQTDTQNNPNFFSCRLKKTLCHLSINKFLRQSETASYKLIPRITSVTMITFL